MNRNSIITGSEFQNQNSAALQRLKVDPGGRFLVLDDGSPFFWLGDTGWFPWQLGGLTDPEIGHWLSNRAGKGFTGIQVCVISGGKWTKSWSGEAFLNHDIYTPNESHWRRVDWMVDEAASLGLYLMLVTMWGDAFTEFECLAPDTKRAYDLGQWLGERYRDRTNALWCVSGEYSTIKRPRQGKDLTDEQKALFNAMAAGLSDGHGGTQLMTIHPAVPRTSSYEFHDQPWLDFNMLQSGHLADLEAHGGREIYRQISDDYDLAPAKPVLDGEPSYEDLPDRRTLVPMGEDVVRRKAYWAVFAGAFGHTYGHTDVWCFWSPGVHNFRGFSRSVWRDALDAPGAGQLQHLRSLIESQPSFLDRIPDQSVIVSDPGSGPTHVRATRASDGKYALVYIPTGNAVTIDMSKISSAPVKASWFSPRNGEYTAIGDYTNIGTQDFDAPGTAAVGNDWVLVLTAAPTTDAPPTVDG